MNIVFTTARQELRSLRRERLPQALLAVFVGMVSISTFIGWLTNKNVTKIWQKVKQQGLTTAPNPFAHVPSLYYLRNTVIYLVLVGALLAIVLGVASVMRDKKAHTLDLVLSRPVRYKQYVLGKLIGITAWLGMILGLVTIISWISVSFIIGKPLGSNDSGRLMAYFAMSLIFLLGFVLLGMICAVYSNRETSALLLPISIWSLITFVLPQLGTAEHPVSLLNPVPVIASQGGVFSFLNSILGPFSITEEYKKASSWILGNTDFVGKPGISVPVLFLALLIGVFILMSSRRDRLRRSLYE